MATFGRYEADRPLYRTAFSTVYALRSTEEGGRQRVIKAQKLSVRMHDETLEAAQGQAFLDSATVQQKVAGFEAESWAPVHELGTALTGPFYVTDRYDFSIQGLVDGHVKLGAAGLHNVVSSIVRGLLALRQACQRPHGNLKPTNILIAGHRDLSQAKIVLCDPLPDRHLDPNAHARADLRRLGEIMHQVVVHGEVPPIAGYQVPPSAHWRKLGKQGEAWRHLCNRLLQANVESAPVTLEDLANQLTALAPRRSRRMLVMAASIAVAVSILLGILFWRIFFPPPDPKVVEQAQKDLAQAEIWLKPLGKVVDEHITPGRIPSYRQQEKYLADIKATTGDRILVELLHNILSCAGYFDRPRNPAQTNIARKDVAGRLFHADARWPWLSDLQIKYVPKLREKKCTLLADYLEGKIGLLPMNEPNGPTEKICNEICEGFEVALDLRTKWPKNIGPNDLDRLEPRTTADDPNLAGAIADVSEFVKRLSLLPDHYQLQGDKLAAWNKSLPNLKQVMENLEAQLGGAAKKVNDPNVEKLTNYRKELPTIESAPTEGRYRLVVTLQKWVDTIDNPAGWYKRTREEAKTETSKSPRLNGWYASYVDERTGDPDTFVQTYKAGDALFSDLKAEVKQTREDFLLFTEDFSRIETALKTCHMLEETPPSSKDTLQTVCDRWRKNRVFGKVLQNEPYGAALGDLRDRVRELEEIDRGKTVDDLLNTAKAGLWLEARYAAWRRLDAGTPPAWPLTEPQWKEEAGIQSRLKNELEQVTGLADRRWTEFNRLCETRERTYRNSSLDELVSKVQARASGVALLRNIGRARPQTNADLGGLREFESTLQPLVDALTSAAWPTQYDLEEFRKDHKDYFADSNAASVQDLENWRKALADYRRIPDPRDHTRKEWAKVAANLRLTENLGKLRADAEKAGKKEQLQKWEQLQKCGDSLGQRFRKVWDPNVSAIERDRTKLGDWGLVMADAASAPIKPAELLRGILTPAWDRQKDKVSLPVLAEMVQRCVAPAYCKWVDLVDGRFVFKPEAGLDKFEPMMAREFSPPSSLSEFDDERNRDLKKSFFERTDGDPETNPNVGWPKYIRAKPDQDPTVVLRFVPQEKPTDPPPFYMAIQEITNEQFARFLDVNKPSDADKLLAAESRATNTEMNRYPRAIDPKTHEITPAERKSHPVVWVTYKGAERYAKWLHAELPKSAWHQRAITYCGGPGLPDPNWYHIRGQAWEAAVRDYNDSLKDRVNWKYAPLGAMGKQEFPAFKEGKELSYVYQKPPLPQGAPRAEWPQPSQTRQGLEIFDLIGNVWEWSRNSDAADQQCICGGSCLSAPTSAAVGPQPFDGTSACDVGFRIAVSCPETGRSDGNPTGSVRIGR